MSWLAEAGKFFILLKNHLTEWLFGIFGYIRGLGDSMIGSLISEMDARIPYLDVAFIQAELDKVNYFFPLSECLVYAAALFGLWVSVFAYRLVKSWIPLVGS